MWTSDYNMINIVHISLDHVKLPFFQVKNVCILTISYGSYEITYIALWDRKCEEPEIQGQPIIKMYHKLRTTFNSIFYDEIQNQIKEKQKKEHEFEREGPRLIPLLPWADYFLLGLG